MLLYLHSTVYKVSHKKVFFSVHICKMCWCMSYCHHTKRAEMRKKKSYQVLQIWIFRGKNDIQNVFLSLEQKNIYPRSHWLTHSLTHSLTHLLVHIVLLKTWQRRWEKKMRTSRGLELEKFCDVFYFSSFLISPHFHTFNLHLPVLIVPK